MLRATIADQNVTLIGCDTMRHAEKTAWFPCASEHTDFCMRVQTTSAISLPDGELLGRGKSTRWVRTADGRMAMFHENASFILSYDEGFSDIALTLQEGLQNREILQYLYTSQCFSYRLLAVGGCSLHSAGLTVDGSGVALCGESGVGKSTIARAMTAVNKRVRILSEDAPAVRRIGERYVLYGTPFCGDDNACANEAVPLKAIVILEKSTTNRWVELDESRKMFSLLGVVPRPVYYRPLGETAVDTITAMVSTIPIVKLQHDGTPRAAAFLQEMLAANGWI